MSFNRADGFWAQDLHCLFSGSSFLECSDFIWKPLLRDANIAVKSYEEEALNSVKLLEREIVEGAELHVQPLSVNLAEELVCEAVHDGADPKTKKFI